MVKSTFFDIIDTAWPTLVIFLIVIILLRIMYLKQNKKKFLFNEELILLLFVTYILLLFELVTIRDVEFGGVNWMPFREILRYDFGTDLFYKQVIGNIILFIPFGYFATYYSKLTKIRHIFFITFITSTTIEIVQRFIGRSFDVDDIILNVVGGIIGFLLFIGLDAIRKKLPKIFQNDLFYNILAIILLILIVLYLFGTVRIG